jgi:hypothetical protein
LATVAWMQLSQLSLAEGYVSVRAGTVGVDLEPRDKTGVGLTGSVGSR